MQYCEPGESVVRANNERRRKRELTKREAVHSIVEVVTNEERVKVQIVLENI